MTQLAFKDNATAVADTFEKRLELIQIALRNCGRNPVDTVGDANKRLVAENTNVGFRDYPDNDYYVRHDLCHIFTDAVGGTPREEKPADQIQFVLFPGTADNFILPGTIIVDSIQERAEIIASLYQTIFNEPLQDISTEQLQSLPLEVFGIQRNRAIRFDTLALQEKALFRTRYTLRSPEERQTLLDEFVRLCDEAGIEVDILPAALTESSPINLRDFKDAAPFPTFTSSDQDLNPFTKIYKPTLVKTPPTFGIDYYDGIWPETKTSTALLNAFLEKDFSKQIKLLNENPVDVGDSFFMYDPSKVDKIPLPQGNQKELLKEYFEKYLIKNFEPLAA